MKAADLLREVAEKFSLAKPDDKTGTIPVDLIARIRKALQLPKLPTELAIPEELAKVVEKFEVHEDLLALVKNGTLEFCYVKDSICFRIPTLQDRKSGHFMYWQGPDKEQWEGGCRFYVNEEHDEGGDYWAWDPLDGSEREEPEDIADDLESLEYWIASKAE